MNIFLYIFKYLIKTIYPVGVLVQMLSKFLASCVIGDATTGCEKHESGPGI